MKELYMCECIHLYVFVYTFVYVCTYIYVYVCASLALTGRFFTTEPPGKPSYVCMYIYLIIINGYKIQNERASFYFFIYIYIIFMYMCICIHMYICLCIYVYKHTHIQVNTYSGSFTAKKKKNLEKFFSRGLPIFIGHHLIQMPKKGKRWFLPCGKNTEDLLTYPCPPLVTANLVSFLKNLFFCFCFRFHIYVRS